MKLASQIAPGEFHLDWQLREARIEESLCFELGNGVLLRSRGEQLVSPNS